MSKSPMPVNFENADHRDKWILDNASYFTVIQRKNRRYARSELPNLKEAEQTATDMLATEPEARLMIYAVYDPAGVGSPGALTAYIKTVSKDMKVKRVHAVR